MMNDTNRYYFSKNEPFEEDEGEEKVTSQQKSIRPKLHTHGLS